VGTEIYRVDDPSDGIHIILSGIVKVTYAPEARFITSLEKFGKIINKETMVDYTGNRHEEDYIGAPFVVGEIGLLTNDTRAASVECETDVVAYHVSHEVMQNALKEFDDKYNSLESRLWRAVGMKLVVEYLPTQPAYIVSNYLVLCLRDSHLHL